MRSPQRHKRDSRPARAIEPSIGQKITPRSRFSTGEHDPNELERIVFLSDGVFAIALTLLGLDLRVPASDKPLTNHELMDCLLSLWPKYIGYVVSFLGIGLFWLSHHRKFRFIKRYDRNLILLNFLLLMFIAFIPFPTSLLCELGNRTATIFYALTMAITGFLSALIWWYASNRKELVDSTYISQRQQRGLLTLLWIPAIFIFSIGLAFINDELARLSWLFLIVPVSIYIERRFEIIRAKV